MVTRTRGGLPSITTTAQFVLDEKRAQISVYPRIDRERSWMFHVRLDALTPGQRDRVLRMFEEKEDG